MSQLKKLQKEIDILYDELYMLHFAEPSPEQYKQRRSEIEYKIACIEDKIEDEKRMAPLKWMLYGFMICACLLILIALLKIK